MHKFTALRKQANPTNRTSELVQLEILDGTLEFGGLKLGETVQGLKNKSGSKVWDQSCSVPSMMKAGLCGLKVCLTDFR